MILNIEKATDRYAKKSEWSREVNCITSAVWRLFICLYLSTTACVFDVISSHHCCDFHVCNLHILYFWLFLKKRAQQSHDTPCKLIFCSMCLAFTSNTAVHDPPPPPVILEMSNIKVITKGCADLIKPPSKNPSK